MTTFWPSGINLEDTESPEEILNTARKQWETESGGKLSLVLQDTESNSEEQVFVVHAQHVESKRTITLFSVFHRLDLPYPARIKVRDQELPNSLKKSYYLPGTKDILSAGSLTNAFLSTSGKTIENKWVCDTPAEFRKNLSEVFNIGYLRSEIVSLLATEEN